MKRITRTLVRSDNYSYNAIKGAFSIQIQVENMFSTGQAKKLQIARAFIKDSSVLIFDEALSNLDDVTKCIITARLKQLAENKIILLNSQNRADYKICDEVYQINNGCLEKYAFEREKSAK